MTPAERLAAFVKGWNEHRPNDRGIIARVFGVPVRSLIALTVGDIEAVLAELADLAAERDELLAGAELFLADQAEFTCNSCGSTDVEPALPDDDDIDLTNDDEDLGDVDAFLAWS